MLKERKHTIRQEIIKLLSKGPATIRDISQSVSIMEKEVFEHLISAEKSLKRQNKKLLVEPFRCLSCGFVFKERNSKSRENALIVKMAKSNQLYSGLNKKRTYNGKFNIPLCQASCLLFLYKSPIQDKAGFVFLSTLCSFLRTFLIVFLECPVSFTISLIFYHSFYKLCLFHIDPRLSSPLLISGLCIFLDYQKFALGGSILGYQN